MDGAVQWIIGDWLNYGEQKYGETYAQALELWPEYAYAYLKQLRFVTSHVELLRRRNNLSFEHHRQVSGLTPAHRLPKNS